MYSMNRFQEARSEDSVISFILMAGLATISKVVIEHIVIPKET